MTTPTNFDTRFAQLCEAFERTTQGEYANQGQVVVDLNTVCVGKESYDWRMVAHCNADDADETDYSTPAISEQQAKANADWFALAHNLMPAIKEEMEALRNFETMWRAWTKIFGTTQLTHAKARLDAAESKVESQASQLAERDAEAERLLARNSELNLLLAQERSQLTEARARIETLGSFLARAVSFENAWDLHDKNCVWQTSRDNTVCSCWVGKARALAQTEEGKK